MKRPINQTLAPIWDFFKSVRLTVVTLLLLAATSILGTVIPQNQHPSDYIQAFGEPVYRLLHILSITDMYSAWWFLLLILTLTVNIIVCTVSRGRVTLKMAFGKGFKGFASLPKTGQVTVAAPMEETKETIEKKLGARFTTVREVPAGKGFTFEAEKGRWTRLGADVVHVGILILLAGALVGSLFGFNGSVNIPEEESISAISLFGSGEKKPLGFSVRCNDFSISHYDSGSVKEYRSSLTIIDGEDEVLTQEIIVNKPLTYKGITFYQASYGTLAAKDFTFHFTEKSSGKVVSTPLVLGESVTLETGRTFTFDRYDADYSFKNRSVGEAAIGTLTTPGATPKEVVLLSRFSNYDKMRKGEWLIKIEGHGHAYYTGLQVTKDPGVTLVYTGFFFMIAGCIIAFFMGHKKIRIKIAPHARGCTVSLFGSAPKNKRWLKHYTAQIIRGLSHENGQ